MSPRPNRCFLFMSKRWDGLIAHWQRFWLIFAGSPQNDTRWCVEIGAAVTWLARTVYVYICMYTSVDFCAGKSFTFLRGLHCWFIGDMNMGGGGSLKKQTLFCSVVSKHSTFAIIYRAAHEFLSYFFVLLHFHAVICQSLLIPDLTDASFIACLDGHLDPLCCGSILSRSCWLHQ